MIQMKKYGDISSGQEALLGAIDVGDVEKVKRLIKSGVSPNFEIDDGYAFSPIYLAILKRNYDLVVWLLDQGGVKATQKIHHWAAVVVGDPSCANAILQRI